MAWAPTGLAQQQPESAEPSSPQAAAAQQRFNRGRELFNQRQFDVALTEFRASLELFRSPNTRLMIGVSLLNLARAGGAPRLAEAHAELTRAFNESNDLAGRDPRYVATRDRARRELDALEPQLGRVVFRAVAPPPGFHLSAGPSEVLPAMMGMPIAFDPGELQVRAGAPGHRDFSHTLQIRAGGTAELVVSLEREAHASPVESAPLTVRNPTTPAIVEPVNPVRGSRMEGGGLRTAGFVVAGIGLAGVATFGVLALMTRSLHDDVSAACRNTSCSDRSYEGDIDRGQTMQLAGLVSAGVGGAAILAGVIMIAVGGARPVDVIDENARIYTRVQPWFDATHGMAGVRGAF